MNTFCMIIRVATILLTLVFIIAAASATDINTVSIDTDVTVPANLDTANKAGMGYADREGINIKEHEKIYTITSASNAPAIVYIPVSKPKSDKLWQYAYMITHYNSTGYPIEDKITIPQLINKSWYVVFKNTNWSYLEVGGIIQFWNAVDLPTLYTAIADPTKISFSGGIYTMHIPFYQNKSTDNFYFGETVHLKTVVGTNVAYYRWAGNTTFNNASIHAWNTTSNTIVTNYLVERSSIYSDSGASGDITGCNMSYLGYNFHPCRGVTLTTTSDISINNNVFNNNVHGIYLFSSCNNTLTNNTATGNAIFGIYLHSACNNTLTDNNATANTHHNIILYLSCNNTLIGNTATAAGVGYYDYSFEVISLYNILRNPADVSNYINLEWTSSLTIENNNSLVFSEDSSAITKAYTNENFTLYQTGVGEIIHIVQRSMTILPVMQTVDIYNIVWGDEITYNASCIGGDVWFNISNNQWNSRDINIYVNNSLDQTITASSGTINYLYDGGWSEKEFRFTPIRTPIIDTNLFQGIINIIDAVVLIITSLLNLILASFPVMIALTLLSALFILITRIITRIK